jgi:hypothetical protein
MAVLMADLMVDQKEDTDITFIDTFKTQLSSPFDLEYYDATLYNIGIEDTTDKAPYMEIFNSTFACNDYSKVDPLIQYIKTQLGLTIESTIKTSSSVTCNCHTWTYNNVHRHICV